MHSKFFDQSLEVVETLDYQAYLMLYYSEFATSSSDAMYLFGRLLEMMKN